MKQYTVNDIAKKLFINPETVRRWIRSGELRATASSRKNGYIINEVDFNDFISGKHIRGMTIENPDDYTYMEELIRIKEELILQRDVLNRKIAILQSTIEKIESL